MPDSVIADSKQAANLGARKMATQTANIKTKTKFIHFNSGKFLAGNLLVEFYGRSWSKIRSRLLSNNRDLNFKV